MKIFSYVKKAGLKKIKLLAIPLYMSFKDEKDYISRSYLGGVFKIKKSFARKKVYILGIQIFSKTDKLRVLELNLKSHMNKKLQEYKVKQQKMFSIVNLHQKVFPQFKNKHAEDSLAIIGSGPSLNYFTPIENIRYIALNRGISYDKVKYEYFFCVDGRDDIPEYLKQYSNYPCTKFYGQHFNFSPIAIEGRGSCHISDRLARAHGAFRFYSNAHDAEWYYDIETAPLMDYGSVSFCALHFAFYSGAKKIYLVGCDCTRNGYFNNANQINWVLLDNALKGYKKVKTFRDIYYPETEIISVNPVGLRGLFKDVYTRDFVEANEELKDLDIEYLD